MEAGGGRRCYWTSSNGGGARRRKGLGVVWGEEERERAKGAAGAGEEEEREREARGMVGGEARRGRGADAKGGAKVTSIRRDLPNQTREASGLAHSRPACSFRQAGPVAFVRPANM